MKPFEFKSHLSQSALMGWEGVCLAFPLKRQDLTVVCKVLMAMGHSAEYSYLSFEKLYPLLDELLNIPGVPLGSEHDWKGWTPLHYLMNIPSDTDPRTLIIAQKLIDKGNPVNFPVYQESIIQLAIGNGDERYVDLLLEQGASLPKRLTQPQGWAELVQSNLSHYRIFPAFWRRGMWLDDAPYLGLTLEEWLEKKKVSEGYNPRYRIHQHDKINTLLMEYQQQKLLHYLPNAERATKSVRL